MPAVEFRKQPLSPAPGSDSDFMSSDGQEHPKPISLLSSMMGGQTSPRSKQYLSGSTSGPSAPSTAPSTTFSSPRPQEEPISILRRSSVGSDGEPFLLPMARALPTSPDKQEIEKQPRLSSLKFAVTSRPSGFEPQPMTTVPQHDDLEDDRGTVTDKGYEEDSEDGFTSDDEPSFVMQAHHKMAMARAREAQLTAARPTSASPPLRPTAPPPRCGRGHVRVDPAVGDDTGRCSRHYSPPPDTRQRSAPPGPRNGRAGSPVPDPMDIDDEDDDDDDDDGEENDNEGAARKRDSSREDITSTSPGASPSPRPTTQQSAGPPSSIGTGVRNMLRRASEHLPSFRRPSFTAPISEELVTLDDDDDSIDSGRVLLSRARSLGARTKPTAVTLSQDNATAIPSRPIACPTSPRSTPRT